MAAGRGGALLGGKPAGPGTGCGRLAVMAVDDAAIERFVAEGFVKVPGAVPRDVALACRDRFALAVRRQHPGVDLDDPSTFPQPSVRTLPAPAPCLREAAQAPALLAACDRLVGPGRWHARAELGMAVVRFPHADAPDDDGWHVDAGNDGTVAPGSPDRALLMLFLLSDVGPDDGPTRIRVGSHRVVATELVDGPVGFMELAQRAVPRTEHLPEALATGDAGDVYLCHPFLVHAAQAVRSDKVRFMTQPPLPPAGPLRADRAPGERSPVERAVADALSGAG
jgi:hypothetical protein